MDTEIDPDFYGKTVQPPATSLHDDLEKALIKLGINVYPIQVNMILSYFKSDDISVIGGPVTGRTTDALVTLFKSILRSGKRGPGPSALIVE